MSEPISVRQRFASGLVWPGTGVVLLLCVIGLLAVWSASWRSAEFGRGYYLDFYMKQVLWVGAGCLVYLGILLMKRKTLARLSWPAYLFLLLLVVSVIVFGRSINGSKRWIVFGPLQIQPSEFMKLGLVLGLARYIATRRRLDRWRDLAVPALIVLVPMAFILRQPDLGTSLVLVPVTLAMLFVGGACPKKLGLVLALMAALAPASYFLLLKDYQKKRVDAFLGQGNYSKQQKIGEALQLIQSKVAVGSGGVAGKGLHQGSQNTLNFIPFRHTDFIFAVIGEEWGFVGAAGTLALYFLAFALSIALAHATPNAYDRLLITGLVTTLAFQVFVNTAMAVGLAPITGLTLPFLSYGGSSMVMAFASFGLIAGARGERRGFSLACAF
jgi:rod shape determining protein RodA